MSHGVYGVYKGEAHDNSADVLFILGVVVVSNNIISNYIQSKHISHAHQISHLINSIRMWCEGDV